MVKVDSKGRVVLPKEVRERLDLAPGTEVEIREVDGKAVVEPERDPEAIVDRLTTLVEEAAAERDPDDYDDLDVYAREHAETVRRQARTPDRANE